MPQDRDADTGQFSEEYPRDAFLDAIKNLDPATTSKVAETVGCSYDLAYRRLTSLANSNDVTKTEIGGTYVWTTA